MNLKEAMKLALAGESVYNSRIGPTGGHLEYSEDFNDFIIDRGDESITVRGNFLLLPYTGWVVRKERFIPNVGFLVEDEEPGPLVAAARNAVWKYKTRGLTIDDMQALEEAVDHAILD